MKLTAPQKEVIRKMREGRELIEYYTGNSFMLGNGRSISFIRYSTYRKLLGLKLIGVKVDINLERTISLTELGKTIEL